MAAYAALVSLMNNIEQIQSHTRLPINFDQTQSQSLLEKVYFLIHFLESYNYHGAAEEIKNLESRIRDAAYAAEDIIETHVVDTIHTYSRSGIKGNEGAFLLCWNFLKALASCLPKIPKEAMKLKDINQVLEDLDSIKDAAIKLKDSNETQDLHHTNSIIEPSISYVPAGKITVVGFDDELKRITERLLARQSNLQVIPIVGMGGIGKTTLAKTAYDKFGGGKHFDLCSWITISQEYDLKKIMLGLLARKSSTKSGKELGQEFYQMLFGRRYLIVLDDMWSVEAWEMAMKFLPDNGKGSRIIVTTRESSVSTCFGSSSHKMSFLDEDQSWSLFCEKVFASSGCPFELEEVGRKIVKNCKGLPLSIAVIGGFLAQSEMRKEYWEFIAQDTKTIRNSADDEQCMKILSLSFQNLPIHLKPCFLYLCAFPEDGKIQASLLIKLWVAEGFLKSNSSKELKVLGEEYLDDLLSRNLILVVTRRFNGKIQSCMIHDLLRDICLIEAQNDKFMYTLKSCSRGSEYIGSQRRVSLHNSMSDAEIIPQVFDTLRSGSMTRTVICNQYCIALQIQNHRLMRIFNTRIIDQDYVLNDTFQLVNSRLIRIGTSDHIIPSSICLIWNLQILTITDNQERLTAPLDIWEMTELGHLEARYGIYLPEPPPSPKINTKEGVTTMKNLHTLKEIRDFRLSDEVVKRIPNIKKLEITYDGLWGKALEDMCLTSLGLLQNLESLNLSFEQLPSSDLPSYLTFPNSLKKLSLRKCGLQWEDMSMIASLPHLEVLKLWEDAFRGPMWELDEEVFTCLKYLVISKCDDLVQWIAEDTHFPCLELLQLVRLDKLVEIPSGIGDIVTLQRIHLWYCGKSTVISVKKILDEQENLGNVSINVMVKCGEDPDLESLASDNFLVLTSD